MGPGVVLAALAIGSGELVLTPRSGAQYGFILLWVPILTIVYKAAFSEGLARLTIASGNDVFVAFDWLPGPRHWAQYFIILVFSLDMIGYGGIALAGGSALAGLFPGSDIRLWALCAAACVPILLYTGSYPFFEKVVVVMCTVLLGDNQPAVVINTIASMNAVVFGLLGFVLLYLDRKLPVYARGRLVLRCVIFAGSTVFLGVAFLKLL